MNIHLVLIDALNLIRRIYAVQERPFLLNNHLSENTQSQVLHNTQNACVHALDNILQFLQPTHALMVFDSEQPCWRYRVFPDYKKGRKKMPEHLASSLEQMQDVFLEHGVDSLVPEQDEADDVIATLAVKLALMDQQVTIVSTDKCYLSLLNPHIQVYDYFNRRYLDDNFVIDKFNVKPSQLIDFWALTGDTTNKIPGVPGIGAKTAAELLNQYAAISLLFKSDSLKPKIKRLLDEHQTLIQRNQKLLSLQQNIQLGFNLKDIRLDKNQPNCQ